MSALYQVLPLGLCLYVQSVQVGRRPEPGQQLLDLACLLDPDQCGLVEDVWAPPLLHPGRA